MDYINSYAQVVLVPSHSILIEGKVINSLQVKPEV